MIRDPNVTIDSTAFVIALLLSLAASLALSFLYRFFFEDRATGSQVHRSFILLGPSITALFIAIQFSLPLSLGLLGALSIVRFRTPIKEPEEIGFIMLLVACSIVIATFKLLLLLALVGTVLLGLAIRHYFPSVSGSTRKDGTVLVTFSSEAPESMLGDIRQALQSVVERGKLESLSQNGGVSTIQFSFCGMAANAADRLLSDFSTRKGITNFNVYFNRATSIN
jgi:hypothetical protein